MPLVKSVFVRLKAEGAEGTKTEMDDIAARAAAIGKMSPTIKMTVADKDARLKLAAIRLELDAVGNDKEKIRRVVAEVRDIGDAATTSGLKLAALRLEMKALRMAGPSGVSGRRGGLLGFLGNLLGLGGGGAAEAGQAAAEGAPAAAAGGISLGTVGWIAGITAGISALLAGAGGILPALVAAGMGVGAFAALAIPTFMKVSGAISQIKTDTQAYDRATTAAAKSKALAKIHADWAALDPVQRTIVKGVQAFEATFSKMATKIEPVVSKIFSAGIGIANKLLPDLLPFAQAAGNAILGLANQFSRFASSPGFKDFLSQMLKLAGPSITTIGQGLGRVGGAFGKLLLALMNPNGQKMLSGLFTVIQSVIQGVTWAFVHVTPKVIEFYQAVKRDWPTVKHVFENIKHAWDNAVHAFNNVKHAWDNVKHFFDNIKHAWDNVWNFLKKTGSLIARFFTQDIPHWGGVAIDWLKGLPGKILGALGNFGKLLWSAGASLIQGLIGGIQSSLGWLGSVLGGIGSFIINHKGPPAKDAVLLRGNGRLIMGSLVAGLGDGLPGLHRQLAAVTGQIAAGVRPARGGVLAGGGGQVVTVRLEAGSDPLIAAIVRALRYEVRMNGQGSVQGHLGWGAR